MEKDLLIQDKDKLYMELKNICLTFVSLLYTRPTQHPSLACQVVEKDLLIQEKEKLYMELKNILARQPGPEVAEQLSIYQANLREKTKQMKAMASELNMYQAQVRGRGSWQRGVIWGRVGGAVVQAGWVVSGVIRHRWVFGSVFRKSWWY